MAPAAISAILTPIALHNDKPVGGIRKYTIAQNAVYDRWNHNVEKKYHFSVSSFAHVAWSDMSETVSASIS